MSKRIWLTRAAGLCLLLPTTACVVGPSYYRVVGEVGTKQPCESISFEARDYGDLARLFSDKLQEHRIFAELQGDPDSKTTPAIAHKEFRIDMTDRNTRASIVEEKIRFELMDAGVRYINEQERQRMLASLKAQHSDLNNPETRAEFGRFANAKYYLVGRIFDATHIVSLNQKKREFHLFIELLELETLESRFACDVVVTKYIES